MLFLVISHPRPEPPSAMVGSRQRYWGWAEPLLKSGMMRSVHARVGRGLTPLRLT